MPNMNTSKIQIARSYLASLTGGWVPYGDEATLNQIIQLYLWVLFASIPIIIQLILQSQWISSCLSFGFIFLIVLLVKLICYNLHKVFDTNESNQLTVPEMIPAWFALSKYLQVERKRGHVRPEPRGNSSNGVFSTELDTAFYVPNSSTSSTGINPTGLNQGSGRSLAQSSLRGITDQDPINLYLNGGVAAEQGSILKQADGSFNFDLNQIDENDELRLSENLQNETDNLNEDNQKEDNPNFDETIITKPSSVDTGLNEIRRLERKKAIRGKSKSTSSHSRLDKLKSDPTELEPLMTGSEPEVTSNAPEIPSTSGQEHPVEPNIVILRNRSTRKTVNQSAFAASARPRGHVQDTSTSCTIRKDSNHCQSDPERLSVSDNKLQAGELSENLKRHQGRSHHLNRTLKSVLSESSVADPSLGGARMAANQDGPKSAENVNEQEQRIFGLNKKESHKDGWSGDLTEIQMDEMVEKWNEDISKLQNMTSSNRMTSSCSSGNRSPNVSSQNTTPFSSSQTSNRDVRDVRDVQVGLNRIFAQRGRQESGGPANSTIHSNTVSIRNTASRATTDLEALESSIALELRNLMSSMSGSNPNRDELQVTFRDILRSTNIGGHGDPRTFDSTSVEGGQLRSGPGLNDSTEPSISRFFPAASITRSISSSERTDDVIVGGGGSREPGIRQSIVIERGSNPTIGRSTTGHSGYSRSNTVGNRDNRGRAGHSKKFTPADLFQKKIPRQKHSFYNVDFLKSKVRLFYTPLELNELMHESKSLFEVFLAAVTAGLISFVISNLSYMRRPVNIFGNPAGSLIFGGFWFVYLFFVGASAIYSLIKSPVPDAASPVHGYSRSMAYARGFYLISLSCLLFLLIFVESNIQSPVRIYEFEIINNRTVAIAIELVKVLIHLLPWFFALGLYSQLKTFLNFMTEQIEFHVFGGSGSAGVTSSLVSLGRSFTAFIILLPIMYYACENDNKDALAFYLSLSVSICYQLSRQTNSNPDFDLMGIKKTFGFSPKTSSGSINNAKLETVQGRLETSFVIGILQFGFFFLITAFKVFDVANDLKPLSNFYSEPIFPIGCFSFVMVCLTSTTGVFIHYFVPKMRELYPWGLFKAPFLRNSEWKRFEATVKSGKVLWFEKIVVFVSTLERNVIYPLAILNETWIGFYSNYFNGWNPAWKSLLLGIACTRLLRQSFRTSHYQWLVLLAAHLLKYDLQRLNFQEPVILTWFIGNFIYIKILGCYQRLGFVYVQLNPGTTWGSAFHAVAQPLSMPHSGFLFLQSLFSTLTSAPLKPLGGSTIFMTSYVRTFRFWEKNYNTKLDDNIRLQSQLEYHRKKDENGNKNALFYENLAFSLKKKLAGDIQLGRYGNVKEGDVFILASSSTSDSQQNGLIQIVEVSNGVVSFQFRGLEFKGTYCQQREVEAITEDVNASCVCCGPRSVSELCGANGNPFCLSFSSWIRNLAMTWNILQKNYILDGYSICDTSASNLFSMFDYRKQVITYFVKCIIYFAIKNENDSFLKIIRHLKSMGCDQNNYVDSNPAFHIYTDIDYDFECGGISRVSFIQLYGSWISYVYKKIKKVDLDLTNSTVSHDDESIESNIFTLCFALSLMGRKALASASHQGHGAQEPVRIELFLHGLHSLFQGNIMPDATEEWIFLDMNLLKGVIAPSLRLAIKLQHDEHRVLSSSDDFPNSQVWDDIIEVTSKTVICHENDPKWRQSILNNEPELFSFRHILDEEQGSDYRILMLIRRQLSFKIIRINPESVRGLWAAQQEELIFIRNQNTERGSIQNSRPVLRNVINSSCDQPIGYPNYVSPILTSYATDHEELSSFQGRDMKIQDMIKSALQIFGDCISTCISCNSGFGVPDDIFRGSIPLTQMNQTQPPNQITTNQSSNTTTLMKPTDSTSAVVFGGGGGANESDSDDSEISAFGQDTQQPAEIIDERLVLSNLDGLRRGGPQLVHWESSKWRDNGGSRSWDGWQPSNGTQGIVVWGWYPCHRQREKRSHIHTPILLLETQDGKYVPVQKAGLRFTKRSFEATPTQSGLGSSHSSQRSSDQTDSLLEKEEMPRMAPEAVEMSSITDLTRDVTSDLTEPLAGLPIEQH